MRVNKRGVVVAIGSAMTLTTIMAAPVFADTTSADVTNEESILDTAAWTNRVAANVQSYANIRSGATTESERVGVLMPGHAAEVVENDGNWSKIKSGNVEGYVRNDLLVFGEEARVHYSNVCGFTGTVDGEGLRVRAEANTDSEILAMPENGSKLTVKADQGDWYNVSIGGTDAYVNAQYLDVDDVGSVALSVEEYEAQLAAEAAAQAAKEAEAAKAAEAASASAVESSTQESASSGETASASSSELNLLAALIQCEAGGESRTGKVAVGAVVLNRVNSGSFANSITDVIYEGGQFSPVTNGSLSRTLANGARSDCYEAAQAALNGENPIGSALYFNSGSGRGIQIGNQHFY
ncbi:MAG TPA: SH3 domain-containing protein [Candidatus Pelethocola excrementipullorum]|nr:SH3 domain-containing protein [Candidatus Pelethocola excrementipullorum]